MFWGFGRKTWDLSSLTRDRTLTPCMGKWSLSHWTTREGPRTAFFWSLNVFCHAPCRCTFSESLCPSASGGLQSMGVSQRVGHSWAHAHTQTRTRLSAHRHTHTHFNSSPCPVTFHHYVISLNSTSHTRVTGMSWLPPGYLVLILAPWLSSQSALTFTLPTCILWLFSPQVVSDSLRPHALHHARLPCPLPSPGVHLHPTYDEMLSPPFWMLLISF